jgi:hypothetical protein
MASQPGEGLLVPKATFALLKSNHLPRLSTEESRILAARVCGWGAADICQAWDRSERDVRRILERLADAICRPAGTRRDPAVLGFWFGLHLDCSFRCAGPALALLSSGALFSSD